MNPLIELLDHGQSYWLDNLTRGMIENGELERRVREEGLRGVTSNPSIFRKAIEGGGEYDEQIERLAHRGLSVEEMYEEIVVEDIQAACDVLRPVYDDSGGKDGFVSLEVSPHLAHDTRGSIQEARHLFQRVNRPNVLIKIPGTPAGVPAVEELLYEGVNVNITLLFSIEAYEAVSEAYLRALERRREEGARIDDVASVASFFLSRIDVLLDRILGHRILPSAPVTRGPAPAEVLGRAAVANAKLAYESFRETQESDRWKELEEAGAAPQRMLWASTSTKNPLYSDVRYVEPLIGPHTINTMPERTIAAFADHGVVETTVQDGIEEARATLQSLGEIGIDFDQVTEQLLHEGVQKFIDPYDRLMAVLGRRRRELLEPGTAAESIRPGEDLSDVEGSLDALDEQRFLRRLEAKDTTLWTLDAGEANRIRDRLGWMDALEDFRERLPELVEFAGEIRREGVDHVLLLGMGGSIGAADVLRGLFGAREGAPELRILDDTDPAAVRAVEEAIDPAETLFVVASKSGTTEETLSLYRRFYASAREALGEEAADRFVAITDARTPLAREAAEEGFRACFENPSDIGGRYSALSYFGLLPAAVTGLDVGELLARAAQMEVACDAGLPASDHPGTQLGVVLARAARSGRDKVTLFTSGALEPIVGWLKQLLAESLGKEGRGLVPVAGEDPVRPEAYGDDRLFVHLRLGGDDGGVRGALDRLAEEGHPVVDLELPDRWAVAGEFYRWEVATAVAGALLGVNPFDEPDVAATKEELGTILEGTSSLGDLPEPSLLTEGDGLAVYGTGDWLPAGRGGTLARLSEAASAGDYIALLPYFHPTAAREEALEALRRRLLADTGCAVTLDYGPRYLHSTGQLHKGGPPTGIHLLLTSGEGEGQDVPIPGRPYGFGVLHRAQALADHRILELRGRRALRVHLRDDTVAGLRTLLEHVRGDEPVARAASPAGRTS